MKRLNKEQIRELPLFGGLERVHIHIIESEQDATKARLYLKTKHCLGFDTESKPLFVKGEFNAGPTLIQLSTESNAYLLPSKFPAALALAKEILIDSSIEKVGFGTNHDEKELSRVFAMKIQNIEDLSLSLGELTKDGKAVGAREAVAIMLGARLTKTAQKSNWARYPLSDGQIKYAANDAYSALCVKKSLVKLQGSEN